MAIMPHCPGLEAHIYVNGEALKEYDDDDDGEVQPRTVTKYVEATSDANFEVRYTISKDFPKSDGLNARVYLDDKFARGRIFFSNEYDKSGMTCTFNGSRSCTDGITYLHRFRFSKMTTDEGNLGLDSDLEKKLDKVGQVSLKIWMATNIKKNCTRKDRSWERPMEFKNIPEKALKGKNSTLSHSASYEAPIKSDGNSYRICDLVGGESFYFAQFIFKYRSLAALKALHVIPRTPSPVPLQDRPLEDMSREDLMDLARSLKSAGPSSRTMKVEEGQNIKDEPLANQRIKRERADDDEVSFVSEQQAKRLRRSPKGDQEVIQLD